MTVKMWIMQACRSVSMMVGKTADASTSADKDKVRSDVASSSR